MNNFDSYVETRQRYDFVDDAGHAWSFRDNLVNAPAMVLLPGALGNADVGWKVVEALGSEVRTLAITYPGGVSARELAEGLAQLLDHLGLNSVSVWSSSYGAWWAQAFAAENPSRVDALWLGNGLCSGEDVAGLPLFDEDWLSSVSAEDVAAAWRNAVQQRPDDELRALQLHMLDTGLSAAEFRSRLLEVASAAVLPAATGIDNTVIFNCDDDPIIGRSVCEQTRLRYPAAAHLTLPQGGHYPHVTHVTEMMPLMRQWLRL